MNPQYVPRDYQLECIDAILDSLQANRSALVVLATGTGKTEIYLQVIERWMDKAVQE